MPTAMRPIPAQEVERGAERPEGTVVRRPGTPGEAECCSQELAALVEHAAKLLDHVVRPPEHRLGDCQPKSLGGL
jgi:hypothetical protein